jgi:hypothetical protein
MALIKSIMEFLPMRAFAFAGVPNESLLQIALLSVGKNVPCIVPLGQQDNRAD